MIGQAALLSQCGSWTNADKLTGGEAVQAFRYFVIDQSVILGILEEPIGNCEEAQPTVSCDWRIRGHVTQCSSLIGRQVTVLIRCPSNKAAWTLQLRHLPRHKSGQTAGQTGTANPGRPMAMEDQGSR